MRAPLLTATLTQVILLIVPAIGALLLAAASGDGGPSAPPPSGMGGSQAPPAPTNGADRYASARLRMVERQIRARGVSNARVLDAMLKVPRHLFVPPELA